MVAIDRCWLHTASKTGYRWCKEIFSQKQKCHRYMEVILRNRTAESYNQVLNSFYRFVLSRAGKGRKTIYGSGRNLAYRKSLFFRNNGLRLIQLLPQGMMIFCKWNSYFRNTVIEMHPDSFTWSSAETSYIDWYRQTKTPFTGSR